MSAHPELDQSRQWGTTFQEIALDHLIRYAMACNYAEGMILDAACGCGYGSALLAKKGAVVGVDADPKAIGWARTYFQGPDYRCTRIEDAAYKGTFQTVVSLETLEHLQDPSPALKAFRKVCTGKLIASVPNEELYPFKAENFAQDGSPHYRHYTPSEFEALLNAHGFNVEARFCQVSKLQPMPMIGTGGRFLIYVCS